MTDTKTMQLIGEIAENVSEKNLSEITYETEDVKIRVVGKPVPPTTVVVDAQVKEDEPTPTPAVEKQVEERFKGIYEKGPLNI